MPQRYENGYFALVLGCAACLLSIGFVSFTVAFSKGYQSADQEHSASYAEYSQAEVNYRECLDSATSLNGARECINNAPTTTQEARRAEQDLNAQREMADWAEGMLWAAWIVGVSTFGATIVGVRYVYLTLIATQDMSRETTRIGEAQVRAYLVATTITARPFFNRNGDLDAVGFKVSIDNTGQSPAIIRKLNFGAGFAYPGQKIVDDTDNLKSIAFMTVGRDRSVQTVEMKMPLADIRAAKSKNAFIIAFVYCEYTDIFHRPIKNNEVHVARIAARIEINETILSPANDKPFNAEFTYLNPEPQG